MTDQLEAPMPDLRAPAPDFSVREYARTAVGSHREHLDLDAFTAEPLSRDTVRVLSFLQAIEHATMNHMRDLLVTPTHKDARVTAFLTTWAFEKFWIADALAAVLSKHTQLTVQAQATKHRITGTFHRVADRFSPIRESLVANSIGVDVIATHVAAGTIDTWLSQAAYERIAEQEPHPELVTILDRIRGIKARHLEFLLPQAEFRLEESAGARKLARKRLGRADWPTGARFQPRSETTFFFTHLFEAASHVLDEIDARIDALPGQSGLHLMTTYAKAHA
jgi:hypothetical protein